MPHLFEFMDLESVPQGLRHTLRDILECGNGTPFRSYYDWVAGEVARLVRDHGLTTVVELGCGTAPITRHLVRRGDLPEGVALVPCDLNPDRGVLGQLEREWPRRVRPVYDPVDFSEPRDWPPDTLLVLSATFHHIPAGRRVAVLDALTASAPHVAVFEPLRRTLSSGLFVVGSLVPAVLTPVRYALRPGALRRALWCWAVPVAPPMFLWDGWVSCIRQWTPAEWQDACDRLPSRRVGLEMRTSTFSTAAVLTREPVSQATAAP